MIIVIYEIRDGEHEYESIDYNKKKNIWDYRDGTVTDLDLLNEQFGVEADDRDSEDSNWYWWGGDRLVRVYSVQPITEDEFNIVSRFI